MIAVNCGPDSEHAEEFWRNVLGDGGRVAAMCGRIHPGLGRLLADPAGFPMVEVDESEAARFYPIVTEVPGWNPDDPDDPKPLSFDGR